jgi:peptidoglycan/LPS O-acetylase OafA/YrhL
MEQSKQYNPAVVKTSDGKIPIVETLRGVASLSVLFHHWTVCVPGFIQNSLVLAFCNRLNIGVYIFFAISGFIMPYALHRGSYQVGHIGKFVLKRIVRLDPPYIASIGFCLVAAYAATLHPLYTGVPFRLDPINLLLHLCYLCPFFGQSWVQGGTYWTLGIEFQFYLIIALSFPLLASRNKWLSLATVGVFTALCVLDGNQYRYKFITCYAPFFSMGMVTFLFRIGRLDKRTYILLLLPLAFLTGIKFELHQMAGGLAASLLIAFYRSGRAPLLFFGTISYSLYLFHFPIALKTVNYLTRYSWAFKYNWLIVLAGSTFCILVAWVAYLLLERPSKMLAQRIKYGDGEKASPDSPKLATPVLIKPENMT